MQVILGQLYQGNNEPEKAHAVFAQAEAIGPTSLRVRAFLANDDLLKGDYEKARRTFLDVEKGLPKGAAPFAVRYGLAFAYLYEGQVDPALDALKTYLAEYKDSGAAQGFPEVFIWNSIARINLENGRLDAAMKAYEKGYESVPGSSIADDQKQVWLGRLHHGRCRTLARMGKHEEAWTEAQQIKKMIDEGGEPAKQYLPAWHYLAGYLKLEAGDYAGGGRRAEAGRPAEPVPQPAARPRVREGGRQGERPEDLPGGGGLAAERPRARARLPRGEAEARLRLSWPRPAGLRSGAAPRRVGLRSRTTRARPKASPHLGPRGEPGPPHSF